MSDAQGKEQRAYEVALQTRNLEIELFWRRANFFWLFVAATFAAFASVYKEGPELALLIAGFGAVCSTAWALANRGSKYWQQAWEARVEKLEGSVTGKLFGEDPPVLGNAPPWLRARRFSVSKLTIALSDFIAFLWFLLALWQLLRILGFESQLHEFSKVGSGAFCVAVFAYILVMARYCRTSQRGKLLVGEDDSIRGRVQG
jgi:hypothetical protein